VIDLYFFPGSASMAVHAALEEAGLEHNLIRATRENGVFGPPEAARLNPAGRIPTMSFDGMAMTEAAACVMHVSDLNPAAGLAPAVGTPERGQWYRWLVHMANTVHPTYIAVFSPGRSAPPEAEDAVKAYSTELLAEHRAALGAHLAANGPYLLGEQYTSADLFLFMLTRWGRNFEPRWWDEPSLGAHYRTIKERPAVQRVFEQEELDDES
jgi:glutathione S-transferase